MDVDFETVSKIAEHRLDLPGVVIEVQPIRYYVLNDLLLMFWISRRGNRCGHGNRFWNEAAMSTGGDLWARLAWKWYGNHF